MTFQATLQSSILSHSQRLSLIFSPTTRILLSLSLIAILMCSPGFLPLLVSNVYSLQSAVYPLITDSEYDNMDEDYLEENGEAHAAHQHANNYDHEDDFVVPSDDEDEDMEESDVEGDFAESDGEAVEEDELDPDAPPAVPFNPVAMGLKEIGGLARFRVSSYKPGNGVDELVNDDTDRYWQYVDSHSTQTSSSIVPLM